MVDSTANTLPGEDSQSLSRAQLIQVAQELLQRPIAYHRAFARIGGGVTAGVMLSQAFYWSNNSATKARGGWFYKTQAEWEEETGLTRREQETARRKLIERGLINEKRGPVRLNGQLFFRVNIEAVLGALSSVLDEKSAETPDFSQNGGNVHSGMAESDNPEWRKRTFSNGGNAHSKTETTSETTSENTHTQTRAPRAVGVGSKFTLEECKRYAEHLRASGEGINNPGGFATKIHHTGYADASIERFLGGDLSGGVTVVASQCPDCDSAGFTHESVLAGAVVKCKHPKLSQVSRGASAA